MERYVLDLLPGEKPGLEYLLKGGEVVVKEVRPGSPAEAARVPVGCVIVRINDVAVTSADILVRELKRSRARITLEVHNPPPRSSRSARSARSDRSARSERSFRSSPIEATLVTPTGKTPAVLQVGRAALKVVSDAGVEEIMLETLSHATLMVLPKGREEVVCVHCHGEGAPALILTELDVNQLVDDVNMRLGALGLAEIEVDAEAAKRSLHRESLSRSSSASSYSTAHFVLPTLRGARGGALSFHSSAEVLESIAATHQFREPGVFTEDLPDTFAAIKPMLARRGGALIFFAGVAKEGLVIVGQKAVYRWIPDETLQHATPDATLSRCMPYSEISEMVIGAETVTPW